MTIHVWAFLGVALVVITSPGPDTVLVTKNALLHGRRAGMGTAFGVNAGLLIWTVAAAFGLAAVVRESAAAFTVLKVAGALYLVWLGLHALRAAWRRSGYGLDRAAPVRDPLGLAGGFRQGVLSNLGNPKIAVFFTSLLPQFVSGHGSLLAPFLLLGSLFVLITLAWLCGYALVAVRISTVLRRPRVKAALDGVTGAVLVGLGVRLALERR
jgi:RhtB (resistance to homoserine/threonine) family protein